MPTPIVRWAQNGPHIDITIDLSDVTEPDVDLTETYLYFRGFGHGAHGEDRYEVHLEFYNRVDYEGSVYNVTKRSVNFKIPKQIKGEEWPRLLKGGEKPAWLKIDFDKWIIEDSEEERTKQTGDADEEGGQINRVTFEQRMRSDIEKSKDDLKIFGKVAWLTAYYLFQVICFLLVLGDLLRGLSQKGWEAYKTGFDDVAGIFLSAQIFALVEIIHPLINIQKVSLRVPLLNVGLRNFVLFVLVTPVKPLHGTYSVYILTWSWTIHELIRFPHNTLILHGFNTYWLQWFRYTYWIVLYPVGFISAGAVIWYSIPIAAERHRMIYALPNMWNISVSLCSLLKLFLLGYVPGCCYLLKHMWRLRRRKVMRRRRQEKED